MAAVREIIGLACDGCKRRNYTTTKNRKTHTDKFSIKKFCPNCRAHTLHREHKVS
ncbi:MAG TPA: 50S ribosomal protein L33 [Candidatus Binataceae bacterium]|jgi:large subunit ribosomal protein L33|nr:50S ribosomal protein L33 [Candidatus Binataceae bacterium]